MQITIVKVEAVTVAVPDGRLDTVTSAGAEQKLLPLLREGSVVADLESVHYVSSAGLRLMLKAAEAAKRAGFSFSICAFQPSVREAFEISGFDKIIPTFATRAEALTGT